MNTAGPSNATPPAATDEIRLLHFGDLHLWRLGWDFDPWPKRLLGLANLVLRRGRKFPPAVADLLTERLAAEAADYLLFSGDLSTTALRAEFEAGHRLFATLRARFGPRFLAVPGNHDRYTPRATRRRLYEKLFLGEPRSYPFATDLNAQWTLVGFDCCGPRLVSSRGAVDAAQFARLDALLATTRAAGRQVLAMGHYPLVFPAGKEPTWEHELEGRAELRALLERHGVAVYLHGHKHVRWRLEQGGITHLNCGSAGMTGGAAERRPGYLRLTLGPSGLRQVEAHWLAPPVAGAAPAWNTTTLE